MVKKVLLNRVSFPSTAQAQTRTINKFLDIDLKNNEEITFSRIHVDVDAIPIGVSNPLSVSYNTFVKVKVNGNSLGTIIAETFFEPEFFIPPLDKKVSLKKHNKIEFEIDYGLANVELQIYADIIYNVSSGRTPDVNITETEKEDSFGAGADEIISKGVGDFFKSPTFIAVALGLVGVLVLSTSGGRTIVYKGAKSGYKRLKRSK